MMRKDIYELAHYAKRSGIRPVIAPCGFLLTEESVKKLKESGIGAISISIDGVNAESHDAFRGVPGAYERTMEGLNHAKAAGIRFQINTTVTKNNVDDLPAILDKAIELGAMTFDLFFLVPTGRGEALRNLAISASKQEEVLHWVWEMSQRTPIRVKTTCAPHYARIQIEKRASQGEPSLKSPKTGAHSGGHPGGDPHYISGGCMAGDGFVFISHRGHLQTCGFLPISCGDLKEQGLNFKETYLHSELFNSLRSGTALKGNCGICAYKVHCGGCRARAYAERGNYLDQEPGCSYQPKAQQ